MTALTNPLKYQPPTLVSPLIVHVGGRYGSLDGASNSAYRVPGYPTGSTYSGTTITNPGGDVLVVADSVVYCSLKFNNLRSMVWIGGEIDIDKDLVDPHGWTSYKTMTVTTTSGSKNITATSGTFATGTGSTSDTDKGIYGNNIPVDNFLASITDSTHAVMGNNASSSGSTTVKVSAMPYDNNESGWLNGPRNCIQVSGVTGTAYFEGLYLHGTRAIDGFKMGSNNKVIIQATRVEAYNHNQLGSGNHKTQGATKDWVGANSGFHCDIIQNYDGIKELYVDWFTGIVGFQGIMLRTSTNSGGAHIWGPTYFSRMNMDSAARLGLADAYGGTHTYDAPRSTKYFGAINFIPFDYAGGSAYGGTGSGAAPDVPANIKGPIFIDDWFINYDPGTYANFVAAMGPTASKYAPLYDRDPDRSSTLTAGASTGTSVSLTVASSTSFVAGQLYEIGIGLSTVENFICSSKPDGTHIIADSLSNTHNNGEKVGKVWFSYNWPIAPGTPNSDPSNELFPSTSKFWNQVVNGQHIREGLPEPTTSHPENPVRADYCPAASVGMAYVSPGYVGVTPPTPPTPPPPAVTRAGVSNYISYPYVS